ncbi:DUF2235 domain-containing protein [Demequina silvatica]|uniref:DUF2235 domain-containing protein n=1 Tax=Demequina silvatica TaxID=1638988 RepID=UPI0007851BBD|nr:DUF2235 domain-containing protein [Demequina silvatica]
MKRIVVCCDGTWSKADQARPTNVVKLYRAVLEKAPDGVEQRAHYLPGVGTRPGERILGGVFGWGLSREVRDGYRAVAEDYEPGDQVFLFGYSRGAYTARSIAGFLRNAGVLLPEHRGRLDEAYALYRDRSKDTAPGAARAEEFRAAYSHPDLEIEFVGVFDTVGSLGIPGSSIPVIKWFNRKWSFHDTTLSSKVRAAAHALAIDEQRTAFAPTLWDRPDRDPAQVLEQVWFAGCHSNVGGGGGTDTGLSDIALGWIAHMAMRRGLAFRDDAFVEGRHLAAGASAMVPYAPDSMAHFNDSRSGPFTLWSPFVRPLLATKDGNETLSSTAVARHAARPNTKPQNLIDALAGVHRITQV